jgi:hypothetical protein
MTIDEVYSNLCYHDARNPEAMTVDPERTGVEKGCTCDNCFYRRHPLAEEILKLRETAQDAAICAAQLLIDHGFGTPGGDIMYGKPFFVPPEGAVTAQELTCTPYEDIIGDMPDLSVMDAKEPKKKEHPFAEFMGNGKKRGKRNR